MPADHLVFTLGTNFTLVKVTGKTECLNGTRLQSHLHVGLSFPTIYSKVSSRHILQAVPLFNY